MTLGLVVVALFLGAGVGYLAGALMAAAGRETPRRE